MLNLSPPETLDSAGVDLWESIASKYDLRPDEAAILARACESADMLAILDEQWVSLGRPFVTKGSMGQEVIHPLVGERRQQAAQQASLLARLKLPDEAGGEAAAPNQHRAAAQSKWAQAHGKGA